MRHSTIHIRRVAALGAVACVAITCSNPTALTEGQLAVQAIPPSLRLTNETPLPAYTFVIERGAAAFTDWAPCRDPKSCLGIEPGATAIQSYSQIVGYTAAASQAIVYWWHLVPQSGGGFQPDTIRAVVTAL